MEHFEGELRPLGKKTGAERVGLSEDSDFATGYDAIFGHKGQTEVASKTPGGSSTFRARQTNEGHAINFAFEIS